jgi:sortase A
VVLTQSADERELLLVPVPSPGGGTTDERARTVVDIPVGTESARAGEATEPDTLWSPTKVAQLGLAVLAILAIGVVIQIAVLSRLEYRSSQVASLNAFRTQLALGTAPIGPVGSDRHLLAFGTPMAVITIPSEGLRAVVLEGTTGSVLTKGPGHVRTSVFPGGAGTSVIYGRAGTYGGPFGRIGDLRPGQIITVTTQVGTSHFRVTRVRPAGAVVRPPAAGTSRLTLGTATGGFLTPSGVIWVDATKIGKPLAASSRANTVLLASEAPLAIDSSTLWALLLWLEALGILLTLAVWTWRRWGHAQTWIVFTAPMLVVWVFISDQIVRLLPNMM